MQSEVITINNVMYWKLFCGKCHKEIFKSRYKPDLEYEKWRNIQILIVQKQLSRDGSEPEDGTVLTREDIEKLKEQQRVRLEVRRSRVALEDPTQKPPAGLSRKSNREAPSLPVSERISS